MAGYRIWLSLRVMGIMTGIHSLCRARLVPISQAKGVAAVLARCTYTYTYIYISLSLSLCLYFLDLYIIWRNVNIKARVFRSADEDYILEARSEQSYDARPGYQQHHKKRALRKPEIIINNTFEPLSHPSFHDTFMLIRLHAKL